MAASWLAAFQTPIPGEQLLQAQIIDPTALG